MLTASWDKIRYFVGIITVGIILGLTFISAGLEIKDYDLWLHLATGRYITQHHVIPATDFLSCSIPGRPWINHEWLFQVIVANLYDNFGPDGIIALQAGIAVLIMALLFLIGYNRQELVVTPFLLLLVDLVFQQRFTHRPDLFSLLFFTVYIFILSLHIDKKWSLPVLFLVQVLWTNMHGFFFFGPLFVMIGLISEFIKRRVPLPFEWNQSGRLSDKEYNRLGVVFFCVMFACVLNPQWIRGAFYPVTVFFSFSGENKIFFEHIQELQKPISWATLFDHDRFAYYKLLIFLSGLSFFFNRRRIDISALFLWGVFLIFSLKAVRNISFFAFAAYFVLISNFWNFSYRQLIPIRFTQKKFAALTSIFLNGFLIAWILNYVNMVVSMDYYDHENYKPKSEMGGVSLRNYPTKAADFLVRNKVKGNFFNDFNSGAYLLGRCFPNIKVYIDGRTEVYGGAFFKDYQKIWKGDAEGLFEKQAEQFGLTGALLGSVKDKIPAALLQYFYHSPKWTLVYFDYDAVIFLRNIPQNEVLIKERKIDLANWQPKPLDIYKIGIDEVSAYQPFDRAQTLESLDFDDQAMAELDEALRINPNDADVYQLQGKIYAKRKQYERAFTAFRRAAMISPGRKEILYNLALAYTDVRQHEAAVKLYRTILSAWPSAKAAFLLTRAQIQNGEYDAAVKTLDQAAQIDPQAIGDVVGIGDVFAEKSEWSFAERLYQKALALTGNDSPQKNVFIKLGDVCEKTGKIDSAKVYYAKALMADPSDEELKKKLKRLDHDILSK